MNLTQICQNAKAASTMTKKLKTGEKNSILNFCADKLVENTKFILSENARDLENAVKAGIKSSFSDRLRLDEKRIGQMADGLRDLAKLDDPVGEVIGMKTLENGLVVGQKRVAMGVIGIIYEARPNVTSDAFGICLKAGSTVVLRGGKEALLSNTAVVDVLRNALCENSYNSDFVQLLTDTSRETAVEFMKMNEFIDVLIPRGGASLIKSVVENATIPVIETGTGNCHIFIDEFADFKNAIDITVNAKVSRPSVCNSAEKLLVHKNAAKEVLPEACKALSENGVEIRGDEASRQIVSSIKPASPDDWYTEYNDLIICIGIVDGIDEAIAHIDKYSTNHSESILTQNYANAQKFLNEVDSAAVYVNASTRFTDGGEFGLGAEIGISTQKLHARGPMGLKELTTTKYIIYGNGQIRI